MVTCLACFTEDLTCIEPPDLQFVQGHRELRPYFAALEPGRFVQFHAIWFDEATQTGAGEYIFGLEGRDYSDHGVAVVELRDGRIAFWREYQREGPFGFAEFIAVEGKEWRWRGGVDG